LFVNQKKLIGSVISNIQLFMKRGEWNNISKLEPRNFVCGHCGREVGSVEGWFFTQRFPGSSRVTAWIYICPICKNPTFFDERSQIPGVAVGRAVENLPKEISDLYEEIRKATSQEAYTAAVLSCRKLLMHIAVEKGAEKNLNFIDYVDYLAKNHYAPPNSEPWIDRIRQMGNEANHEIKIMSRNDALEIINFLEMLLKFIYEFPGKVNLNSPSVE